jgi:hypothetical protein
MRVLSDYFLFFASFPELMLLLKASLVLTLGLLIVWANHSERASVRHLLLTCTFAVLLASKISILIALKTRQGHSFLNLAM